jgi:hypothetical protein
MIIRKAFVHEATVTPVRTWSRPTSTSSIDFSTSDRLPSRSTRIVAPEESGRIAASWRPPRNQALGRSSQISYHVLRPDGAVNLVGEERACILRHARQDVDPRLASSRPKAFARTRPLSGRFFHLPRDCCLSVPTVHRRLPPAGRFGAWFCSQIRRLPRKRDRPDSPGLGLQYVATKIDGGKTSLRVALTMVESCCSLPLH